MEVARKMNASSIVLAGVCAGGLLVAAGPAGAQASAGPAAARGFSSQLLIAQLSLYLPEEATRGMSGASARRARARVAMAQAERGAVRAGSGSARRRRAGRAERRGGRGFPQIQFTRDPDALPHEGPDHRSSSPSSSPFGIIPCRPRPRRSRCRRTWTPSSPPGRRRSGRSSRRSCRRSSTSSASSMGANGSGADGRGYERPGERTARVRTAPRRTAQAPAAAGPQVTLLQRRQRQLDAFIKVLQDRLKQVTA